MPESVRKKSRYAPVVKNNLCRHLRSKGMYTGGYHAVDPHALPFNATNWWCDRTQKELGPDDCPCDGGRCGPGRACYVAEAGDLVAVADNASKRRRQNP